MATDGVKYSEFTPLPAGQLAGNENFVGLKNGVNVRLEGDWREPMADLLRPLLNYLPLDGGTISGESATTRLIIERTADISDDNHAVEIKNANGGSRLLFTKANAGVTWRLATETPTNDFGITLEGSGAFEFKIKENGSLELGRNGAELRLNDSSGATETVTADKIKKWDTPSGGATGSYSIMPSIELSGNDEDGSNNIAVTLDLSEGTVWTIDCTNSPLMNTSGSINVTVTNLPAGSNTGVTFQVYFKQAGRKGVNWTLPAGVTASWAGTQSYGADSSSVDVVQGYWLSSEPGTMHFSIIDKR